MKVKTTELELWLKAKEFADELTSHNVNVKRLKRRAQITREYIANNRAVADTLLQRGISIPSSLSDEDGTHIN